MNVNLLLGNLFRSLGYEVRRQGRGFNVDAFDDQQALLRDRVEVRTILDLGANVGQTARHYHQLFPAATIHSFEPFEGSYQALSESVRSIGQIRPHRLAVADAKGNARFFQNKDSVTNSLLPASEGARAVVPDSMMGNVAVVEVPTTTLDDFCAESGIDAVQILKMDIQGGELLALQGATRLLKAGAITLIYAEVLFADLYEGQADFHQVCGYLNGFGYALYGLYNLSHGGDGLLAWGDAIFLAPELRAALARG